MDVVNEVVEEVAAEIPAKTAVIGDFAKGFVTGVASAIATGLAVFGVDKLRKKVAKKEENEPIVTEGEKKPGFFNKKYATIETNSEE